MGRRKGLLERLLFSFMGPPQLGDVSAPLAAPADPAADLCRRCGSSWADHERVRSASSTYVRCPESPV